METSSLETLQGIIERVTFHQPDTGFCVLRAKVSGKQDLVTVIASAARVTAGEQISCQGNWVNDRQFGLQFKAQHMQLVLPNSLQGIEKYLSSGLIKGIGTHFAKKLIKAFGERVFEVIEQTPAQLKAVPGIGKKRYQQIITAWEEQKSIRRIMIFLQTHGVGTARSVRIYKLYGQQAVERIQENPYCLALDVWGIGFKTADQLAEKLGISKDALIRAQAGVRHAVQQLCEQGHCAVWFDQLMSASQALLEVNAPLIAQAIADETAAGRLVQEGPSGERYIYPAVLYHAEVKAAERLLQLQKGTPPWGTIYIEKALPWAEEQTGLLLSVSQKQALEVVLSSKLSIITGGPGVGKTTLVNSLLKIIQAKKQRVSLCAPTGRAAKRLTETTGLLAKTIHRLLQMMPKTRTFKHNQDNPIPCDVLIVDESSMLDLMLFHHLLKAVPLAAAVIFVGDVDQLPSVGSGAILSDMITSNTLTVVRLTEIFRQAATSQIIVNAHRVNQGFFPLPNEGAHSDFYTIYANSAEEIQQQLIEVVCARLPKRYHFHPLNDIQVLTPMKRGILGTNSLNIALQERLNGQSLPKVTRFGMTFAPGDKVIQMTNNYNKEVYNGDIGIVESIASEEGVVHIHFEQGVKAYQLFELDEVTLAYAISIHKSQGSEFPVVVIPVSTQHFMLLARNLLYTAITRGKKMVILIAQKQAVGMAVHNNQEMNRLTRLVERLQPTL